MRLEDAEAVAEAPRPHNGTSAPGSEEVADWDTGDALLRGAALWYEHRRKLEAFWGVRPDPRRV